MAITIQSAALEVTLFKMIKRTGSTLARYSSMDRQIDLTPYLGEAGQIRTTKAVDGPAGGFTISFADAVYPKIGDSFYAAIEPMDMIEIRASRMGWFYQGTKLPLIMRGFVSSVRRVESMGSDGKPQRVVVISGQDSGKLLQINEILWLLAGTPTELEPFIDAFQLQATTGLDQGTMRIADFMSQVIQKVVNPKIQALAAASSQQQQIKPFLTSGISSGVQGSLAPTIISTFQGSIWNLINGVADRPWNELWVRDTEAGPELVFRPVPYMNLSGSYPVPGAEFPGREQIDIAQVISLDMQRSDSRVANIFWVPPGPNQMDSNFFVSASVLRKTTDTAYQNDLPALFGTRKMEAPTVLMPSGSATIPSQAQGIVAQQQAGDNALNWVSDRATQLQALNRDNAVLEEGEATVMGSELLVPGQYLEITRGGLSATSYMPSVEHSIQPLAGWTSTVRLERGTGFIQRDSVQGSPYWAEGRPGVY